MKAEPVDQQHHDASGPPPEEVPGPAAAYGPAIGERTARGVIAARGPWAFLGRRLIGGVLTLFVASVLIFLATSVLPGDVGRALLGRNASPESVAALNSALGLDNSLPQRYVTWIGNLLQGDLGKSGAAVAQGSADAGVGAAIADPVLNTATLALVTMLVLIPVSLLLGVITARRVGSPVDRAFSLATVSLIAVPEFVIGAILAFAVGIKLGLVPPVSLVPAGQSPLATPDILILPVITLLCTNLAWTSRLVRAGMIEVLDSDYSHGARLNGYPERRVVWRYGLRNGLAVAVSAYALTAQLLVGGVVLTEQVFSYPGLGATFLAAVNSRDLPLVQTIAMLIAALYVVINIVADLVVVWLVPKLRTELL